jgi:hypothetical protein
MSMAQGISTDSPGSERPSIRLADHPRAKASISRAKAWGAVLGFGITAWLGYRGGVPFVDLVVRCIVIGALTCLATWGAAQAIWKQIVFAELALARKNALETQEAILGEFEDPSRVDGEARER